jgi:hypothetical protein
MQAILKFNLPEDSTEHLIAVKAFDLVCTIDKFDQWLRENHKYDKGDISVETAELLRNKLREIMADYGLSFDSPIFA